MLTVEDVFCLCISFLITPWVFWLKNWFQWELLSRFVQWLYNLYYLPSILKLESTIEAIEGRCWIRFWSGKQPNDKFTVRYANHMAYCLFISVSVIKIGWIMFSFGASCCSSKALVEWCNLFALTKRSQILHPLGVIKRGPFTFNRLDY